MASAREAALSVLLRMERDSAYSTLSLGPALEGLSGRDAALATALVYGVTARRLTLDFFLDSLTKRPLKKMQPVLRQLLRLGAYQLLFMEKIPPSAAVNESVNLAKKHKLGYASGFLNGVLRALAREADALPYPDPAKDRLAALEVRYSCPRALISFWRKAYGEERTLAVLERLNDVPPITVRVNTLRISRAALAEELAEEGVAAKPVPDEPGALFLDHAAGLTGLRAFKEGRFFVQGLSSQKACRLLSPAPGETVFDLCAAPGGKSFTLALIMEGKGNVRAFDLYPARVKLIEDGAARLGLGGIVHPAVRDAAKPDGSAGLADRVLCDVPCSGLGVICRKPEIRYKNLKTFDGLPDLQYHILYEGAGHVRPGGTLVYSTCTLNPAENEEVVRRFLGASPAFEAVPFTDAPNGVKTLFPSPDGMDGFFMAKLRRK